MVVVVAQPYCNLPKAGAITGGCQPPGLPFTPLHLFIGASVPGLHGCSVPWYQAKGSNSDQAPLSGYCSFHSEEQGRIPVPSGESCGLLGKEL